MAEEVIERDESLNSMVDKLAEVGIMKVSDSHTISLFHTSETTNKIRLFRNSRRNPINGSIIQWVGC